MAYICYKTSGCKVCPHYRYDSEEGRMCCWAKQDEQVAVMKQWELSIKPVSFVENLEQSYIGAEVAPGECVDSMHHFKYDKVFTSAGEKHTVIFYVVLLLKNDNQYNVMIVCGKCIKKITGAGNGVIVDKDAQIEHYLKKNISYDEWLFYKQKKGGEE